MSKSTCRYLQYKEKPVTKTYPSFPFAPFFESFCCIRIELHLQHLWLWASAKVSGIMTDAQAPFHEGRNTSVSSLTVSAELKEWASLKFHTLLWQVGSIQKPKGASHIIASCHNPQGRPPAVYLVCTNIHQPKSCPGPHPVWWQCDPWQLRGLMGWWGWGRWNTITSPLRCWSNRVE